MVFNSFLKRMFFFGNNTPEEKLCRDIWFSFVKFFKTVTKFCFVLCIHTKPKLTALFFLQTLVVADTDEHRVLLRNRHGNTSFFQIEKREFQKVFVGTLKFWCIKKLFQPNDSRCCFCEQPLEQLLFCA